MAAAPCSARVGAARREARALDAIHRIRFQVDEVVLIGELIEMPEHSVAPEKRGKAGGVRAGATLGSAVAAAGSVGLSGHSGPQRHPFFLHRAHLLEEFGRPLFAAGRAGVGAPVAAGSTCRCSSSGAPGDSARAEDVGAHQRKGLRTQPHFSGCTPRPRRAHLRSLA